MPRSAFVYTSFKSIKSLLKINKKFVENNFEIDDTKVKLK